MTGTSSPRRTALPSLDEFRTVLFDLDGTVYLDGEELPGAGAFIRRCLDAGCLVRYVTNLSLFPKSFCLDALERMGVHAVPREVLTAVDVLMSTLHGRVGGRSIGVLAADHVLHRLTTAGYVVHDLRAATPAEPLDAIVVAQVRDLDDQAPRRAHPFVEAGVPVFTTSMQGAMPTSLNGVVAADEVLQQVLAGSEARVVNCGKPSQFFSAAIDELIEVVEPTLVVGDTIGSDMVLARDNGWAGLLVGPRASRDGAQLPDFHVNSLLEVAT